jgi:Ribosomal protein L11 methyltransferase (PrmA)
MYLWRKAAQPHWLKAREEILQARFGGALSIISRPERKRVQIEVACTSRKEAQRVIQEFGGRAKRLGRDWLKRLSREEKPKPLRIGKRLVVTASPSKREAGANARLNRIENVDFQLADVRSWNSARRIDITTANLFSELLIQILPKLKRSSCLILSGVLRTQEKEFVRALRHHKINPVEVRRRAKWISVLAKTI